MNYSMSKVDLMYLVLGGNTNWEPLYLSLIVDRPDTAANTYYAHEKWGAELGFRVVKCSVL